MHDSKSEQDKFYKDKLQPHESILRAWLRSRYSDQIDVDDIIQESLIRVMAASLMTSGGSGELQVAPMEERHLPLQMGWITTVIDNIVCLTEAAGALNLTGDNRLGLCA